MMQLFISILYHNTALILILLYSIALIFDIYMIYNIRKTAKDI